MDSDSEVICLCILVQFNSYSRCTRYKDMTGSAKCRKWGDLGWLGVTDLQYHNSIECIRLPIQLDPRFSHFSRSPTSDRRTDRQTLHGKNRTICVLITAYGDDKMAKYCEGSNRPVNWSHAVCCWIFTGITVTVICMQLTHMSSHATCTSQLLAHDSTTADSDDFPSLLADLPACQTVGI